MKNKAVIALGLSAVTLLSGCRGENEINNNEVENFDPSSEYEVDVYGPMPEYDDEFNPELEMETTKYGAYILTPEEKDKIIGEEFDVNEDDDILVTVYGPMTE